VDGSPEVWGTWECISDGKWPVVAFRVHIVSPQMTDGNHARTVCRRTQPVNPADALFFFISSSFNRNQCPLFSGPCYLSDFATQCSVYKTQLSVPVYPEEHKFKITASEVTSLMARMILTIIINQNYWVFGLFPSSGILDTRKHDVLETGCVSVLRWRGEDTYSVGSLRKS
jgi:hypothetical protein